MATRAPLLLLALTLPAGLLLYAAAPAPAHASKPVQPTSPLLQRGGGGQGVRANPADRAFTREVMPLIHLYCAPCHNATNATAGLSLTGYPNVEAVLKARDVWDKVARNVESSHMPPDGVPHPTPEQ